MKESFENAMKDAGGFILRPGCKTEVRGYFTDSRIDRDTVPEGWYIYDFRENDYGNLSSIEEFVLVNHGGTFLTKTPLRFPERIGANGEKITRKNIYLRGRGGYTFTDADEIEKRGAIWDT